MRKIKILIVEDEVIVASDIAYYLKKLGCEVMGILVEGEEVIPFLKNHSPDIILMDIRLKGNLDGIQTVHLLKQQYNTPVIYLTANTDDHSFEQAKATKPFAFVEKPFKPKKLVRTVELLIEQIAENEEEKNDSSSNQFVMSDRIFVREKGKMIKIFLTDILYIEADGAYSKIATQEKAFLVSHNLSKLETRIANEVLMRVHRSYIINLEKIDSIEETEVHILKKTIPISRSYWNDFLKRVNMI